MRVLSRYFRGNFLARLVRARSAGLLRFGGAHHELVDDRIFGDWVTALTSREWVVYAKPPFGSPEHVLKYLARYTHRVAISNSRITNVSHGNVSFRFRDAKRGDVIRTTTMSGVEFLRRFLLHVLPSGFVRIRYFGLMGNRRRAENLARCRELLGAAPTPEVDAPVGSEGDEAETPRTLRCAFCGSTDLVCVGVVPFGTPLGSTVVVRWDTS